MDNVFCMATDAENAQEANYKMEDFVGKKNLQFNLDESAFIIVGSSKDTRTLKRSISKSPLTLCGEKMKEVSEIKYLGDWISSSLEESVQRTVSKRINIAKHAVIELRNNVEDSRASKIGGINAAFYIFEAAILSMLLYNGEMFVEMSKKTEKELDNFFNFFLRKIHRLCTGCPIQNLYWQTGFLKAGNIILAKKLNFCHHLSNLPGDSLGREVYDCQKDGSLPGLVLEVKEDLEKIGITDLKTVYKRVWKNKVTA